MSKPENPDIFYPLEVPQSLLPYVRRVLVTDSDQDVDMQVQVGATGYNYFGWTWRGAWQANMNGVQIFDTDTDGPLHMTGQVRKSDVYVRLHRDIATMFLEFTALGHFQLLGVTGAQLAESATAPEQLNPALKPAMEKIRAAQDMSPQARLDFIGTVFEAMPKHSIPNGIQEAIQKIEAADGDVLIGDLVTDLDMSERTFRPLFAKLIGLSPKAFCTTLQINNAFNQILMSRGGDLADVALRSGFSDQAHFTRAFGGFLGKAPKSYLKDVEATLERFVGQSRA